MFPLDLTGSAYQLGWPARAYRACTSVSDDLKRCTKCGEEKPPADFSRNRRSRKDGRASWCEACVRRWQQDNAEHMADYHRRWQRANPEKRREHYLRYREPQGPGPQMA
jgi:hypothetical protein